MADVQQLQYLRRLRRLWGFRGRRTSIRWAGLARRLPAATAAAALACAIPSVATPGALPPAAAVPPAAATDPGCPDVEVIYARGTSEEPGVGPVGRQFTDALRSRLGAESMTVYPVDYPATEDWPTGVYGVRDASSQIQSVVAKCPKTRLVLSGWSQGAAVVAFVTAASVPEALPEGLDPADVPNPMPPEVADHVAAMVLFAKPNDRAMSFLRQPPIVIGPLYTGKTIEYCVEGDVICSDGLDLSIHDPDNYAAMVDQGAAYAAGRLQSDSQRSNSQQSGSQQSGSPQSGSPQSEAERSGRTQSDGAQSEQHPPEQHQPAQHQPEQHQPGQPQSDQPQSDQARSDQHQPDQPQPGPPKSDPPPADQADPEVNAAGR